MADETDRWLIQGTQAPEVQQQFENMDELIRQMQLDELADAPLITPVNYAKLYQNMTPQTVYYHIKRGHLRTVKCPCGRKCVVKDEADKFFKKGAYEPGREGTAAPEA